MTKCVVCFGVLLAIPAIGQQPVQQNAAADVLKKRMESIRLLAVSDEKIRLSPNGMSQPIMIPDSHAAGCAIPLGEATPKRNVDSKMPVAGLNGSALQGDVVSTMPTCGK